MLLPKRKQCTKCGRKLPATTEFFHKAKKGKYGLKAICKECRKQYKEQHKEEIAEYQKQYKKTHKNEIKEYQRQWKKDNPHVDFNNNIKQKYGVDSNITKEQYYEILEYFGYKCAYCSCELNNSNTTLDHILPLSSYYIVDIWNVVPCCRSCNSSKNNKELLDWLSIKESMDLDKYEALLKYVDIMYNKYN